MADTEKITVNLNVVDLGKIDLLVDEGFFTNRTDFIRTAIRKELDQQGDYINATIKRKEKFLGILKLSASDLEAYQERGEMIEIDVVGYLNITSDVTPDLAEATIKSIKIQGVATHPNGVFSRLDSLGRILK